MKSKKFIQSEFIFWQKEETKNDLSVYRERLSTCLSYEENHDIVYAAEPEVIRIKDTELIMIGEKQLERVKKMQFHFEDSITGILMYFKRELEYLSKMFFQTFYTFDDVTLTKQSRKETKKNMGFKRHKILKERPPEIKEIMVLLI